MEELDMTLFSELGDVLGLDQVFYDEEDARLVSGSKPAATAVQVLPSSECDQQLSGYEGYMQSYPNGTSDIDGLLSESHALLDQLMQTNSIDNGPEFVDLSEIDELAKNLDQHAPYVPTNDQPQSLDELVQGLFDERQYEQKSLSDVQYEPMSPTYEPVSPVPTLPSEPSTPVNLFNLENVDLQAQYTQPAVDEILQYLVEDAPLTQLTPEECSSPLSFTSASSPFSDQLYEPSEGSTYSPTPSDYSDYAPVKKSGKRAKTPYSKLPAPRKERKKLQNKNAANRYRQKKKEEMSTLCDEEQKLVARNTELKGEVTNIEREIMCMKELLSEVFDCHSF